MELKNIMSEIKNSMDVSKAYWTQRKTLLVNQKKNQYKYPNQSIMEKIQKNMGEKNKRNMWTNSKEFVKL